MELTTNDIITYLNNAKVNYILVQPEGEPLKDKEGNPIVYGGVEDYEIHKQHGDSVITEYDYIMDQINGGTQMRGNDFEVDLERDEYGFRDFFNAGMNDQTCQCDEFGCDVYEKDEMGGWHYIGSIPNVSTSSIEELTEDEFNHLLDEYDIY